MAGPAPARADELASASSCPELATFQIPKDKTPEEHVVLERFFVLESRYLLTPFQIPASKVWNNIRFRGVVLAMPGECFSLAALACCEPE